MLAPESDTWDMFASLEVGRTPSLTPASTQSGSGEYNAFSYVGAIASGGPKRSVFVVGESSERRCFGIVGSNKFCLRECLMGSNSCGIVTKHETSKFDPDGLEGYIRVSDTQALRTPTLKLDLLTDAQRTATLEKRFSVPEWEQLFTAVSEGGVLPGWLMSDASAATKPEPLQIDTDLDIETTLKPVISPLRSEELVGIFKTPPALKAFSASISDDGNDDDPPIEDSVATLQAHALEVERKWSTTFQEVEASYMILVDDIRRLYEAAQSCSAQLGSPPGGESATVWGSIITVQKSLARFIEQQSSVEAKQEAFIEEASEAKACWDRAEVQLDMFKFELRAGLDRLNTVEERITTHSKRFENIRPGLLKIRELLDRQQKDAAFDASGVTQELASLNQRLTALTQQVENAAEDVWNLSTTGSRAPSANALEEFSRDFHARIKQLEQRVVGEGVTMGTMVFQSFDDLRTWVTASLPKYRYGLFVDAGGLLDQFAFIGFTDFEKTMASMSNVQKTGFATMYEARLAASMQNVLPSIFGRPSSDGMDTSEFLPAVTDPDRWDNGSTGLAHQISRAMIDVESQLDSTINTVFESFPEARQLAKDCLYQSKRFVTDLCNYASKEQKAWQQRGHSKREAWKIVCTCIRRIFEELHSARVIARDVRDITDPAFTSAKMIWAVLKSHAVMAQYVKHQFLEHPSISAVLARHLAANFTKTDDGLAAKVTLLESKVKALTARLDRFEAKAEATTGGKGKKGYKRDTEDP